MRFSKRKLHFLFIFNVGKIETEKKMEKAKQNLIKIVFFKVAIQKCEKSKNGFFKNCLTLCVSGRRKTRLFVHTICFGQKLLGPKTV